MLLISQWDFKLRYGFFFPRTITRNDIIETADMKIPFYLHSFKFNYHQLHIITYRDN